MHLPKFQALIRAISEGNHTYSANKRGKYKGPDTKLHRRKHSNTHSTKTGKQEHEDSAEHYGRKRDHELRKRGKPTLRRDKRQGKGAKLNAKGTHLTSNRDKTKLK